MIKNTGSFLHQELQKDSTTKNFQNLFHRKYGSSWKNQPSLMQFSILHQAVTTLSGVVVRNTYDILLCKLNRVIICRTTQRSVRSTGTWHFSIRNLTQSR